MRVKAQSLAFGSDANLRWEKKGKGFRKEGKGANGGQKGRFTGENSDEDGCLRGKLEGVVSYPIANAREGEYIPPPVPVDYSVRSTFTVSQVTRSVSLVILPQTFAAVPCFPTVREGG